MFTKRSVVMASGASRGAAEARRQGRGVVMMLLLASIVCASLLAAPSADAAERLPSADRKAIEETIRQQLDAFGRDDAEKAFGFATPDIQRMFGSSDNFLYMVRESYEPVYRSAGVQFVRLETVDGQWVQTVQLVDGEGRVWRALFTMKRQPDKTWKVGGCQLVQTSALAT